MDMDTLMSICTVKSILYLFIHYELYKHVW